MSADKMQEIYNEAFEKGYRKGAAAAQPCQCTTGTAGCPVHDTVREAGMSEDAVRLADDVAVVEDMLGREVMRLAYRQSITRVLAALRTQAREPDGRELAKARDAWFASDEGQRCVNEATLGLHPQTARYLQNRLETAFLAGAHIATPAPVTGQADQFAGWDRESLRAVIVQIAMEEMRAWKAAEFAHSGEYAKRIADATITTMDEPDESGTPAPVTGQEES